MTPPAAAAPAIHRGRTAAPPRPRVAPPRPRRVSGPARRPAHRARPPVEAERGLALGLLAGLNGLSRHQALDRLTDRRSASGRAWIALIAFALIGIVTLQLLVLRLNADIGRALVRAGQLQRQNVALSIEGSELAAGERVESQAARLGMELVPEGALRFLSINPRFDVPRAAAALSAPVHAASTASTPETSSAPTSEASAATTPEASAGSSPEASAATAPGPTEATSASSAGEAPAPASPSAPAPVLAPPTSAGASAAGTAEAAAATVGGAGGVPPATQANGAG